jgi:PhzF family phenazine biosynthesis protein
MTKLIHRIDAFAEGKYKGNPAGVYYLKEDLSDIELQKIAKRAGLPVTAFVKHIHDNQFHIRWFTMNTEVNLCGHATMAASYSIAKEFGLKEIQYQSKSGSLKVSIFEDEKIAMDFPTQVTSPCDELTRHKIEETLGIKVKNCNFGFDDYLVELESGQAVVEFQPDFEKILQLDCRGIIITSWDDQYGFDCISRFFCPQVAIDEDQVCVSAHCKLVPYWQAQKGKQYLHAWQASKNGGELHLYSMENNRVQIQGKARFGDMVVLDD